MQTSTRRAFLLFFFFVSSSRHVYTENSTEVDAPEGSHPEDELTNLRATMTTLNSLSDTQKQIVEEQRINEETMQTQQKQEEEREAARSVALATDRKLLDEIPGTVSRKIKYLSKNNAQGEETQVNRPKDCGDVYLEGNEKSGEYRVWPSRNTDGKSFAVYCNMDYEGGGWTVIHRLNQLDVPKWYFYRYWRDYKKGFGDLQSGFWLGNELIHELTSQGFYELRFVFTSDTGIKQSVYDGFYIEDEQDYYKLNLGKYLTNGTVGDFLGLSNGKNFTTQDQNNLSSKYLYYKSGCPEKSVGWWYNYSCLHYSEMNPQSTVTEMMIRQKLFLHKKTLPP